MLESLKTKTKAYWKPAALLTGVAAAILFVKSAIDHERAVEKASKEFSLSLREGDVKQAQALLRRFPEITKTVLTQTDYEPRTALEEAIRSKQETLAQEMVVFNNALLLERAGYKNDFLTISFAPAGTSVFSYENSEIEYCVARTDKGFTNNPFAVFPVTYSFFGLTVGSAKNPFFYMKSTLYNTSCSSDPEVVRLAVRLAAETNTDLAEAFADGEFNPTSISTETCAQILREELSPKKCNELFASRSPSGKLFSDHLARNQNLK